MLDNVFSPSARQTDADCQSFLVESQFIKEITVKSCKDAKVCAVCETSLKVLDTK